MRFPRQLLLLSVALVQLFKLCQAKLTVVECLYVQAVIMVDDGNSPEAIIHQCVVPEEEDGSREMIYDLAPAILDHLDDTTRLKSGETWLTIVGGVIHRNDDPFDDDRIEFMESRDNLFFRVETRKYITEDGGRRFLHDAEENRFIGTRSIVMVRLKSKDGLEPSHDTAYLEEKLLSNDIPSLASQFYGCSGGALEFVPSEGGGVVDMYLGWDLTGMSLTTTLQNRMKVQFERDFGSVTNHDHILYCLPPEMNLPFSAMTYGKTYQSFYNDLRCGYMSNPIHEVGHNLGFSHSAENGDEYGDQSCLMGKSWPMVEGPVMCFNAYKLWSAGWFADKSLTVDPLNGPQFIRLVAFTDANKIPAADQYEGVLVNVGDLYVNFNRAEGPNRGTLEKRNRVAIVRAVDENSRSEMMEGLIWPSRKTYVQDVVLGDGETHTVKFEICGDSLELYDGIDMYILSIHLDEDPSACYGSSPTAAPRDKGFCFSPRNTVQLENGNIVPMKDLRIGDSVLVDPRSHSYEKVYGFAHYDESLEVEYLQIHVDETEEPLEITEEHMVYVPGREHSWYPASTLQGGDQIVTTTGFGTVRTIETILQKGLYGPLTPSGQIVVSGVLASNYVGMQGDSPVFMVGSVGTPWSYQWLANTFEVPHRIYCELFDCSEESYTAEGLSLWLDGPYGLTLWLLEQNVVVVVLMVLCMLLLVSVLVTIRFMSHYPLSLISTALAVALVSQRARLSTLRLRVSTKQR